MTSGEKLFKLTASDGQAGEQVGESVAVVGTRILLGSPVGSGEVPDSGTVHVFSSRTGMELYELSPVHPSPDDRFGRSVAIQGERALVGAPWNDNPYPECGSMYLFAIPQQPATPFCSVEGVPPCPCGNQGDGATGCANASGVGASLVADGSTSVVADDLLLLASGLLPSEPAILFTGSQRIAESPFGDGLLCTGGLLRRVEEQVSRPNGALVWGPGLIARETWRAGDTRYLQVWYRDTGGPCGSGANLTNALALELVP